MGLEIERKGEYTRLKYVGYNEDREWYIKEQIVPGVVVCIKGELRLNLPTRPNLLQMFPDGGF